MVVPRPDIRFQLLDGTQATAHADELQALHAEVYANPLTRAMMMPRCLPTASGSSAASRVCPG